MLSIFMIAMRDDTTGATAIEYGLIAALIAIAAAAAIQGVAGTTIDMWNDVADKTVAAISG